MPVLGDVLGLAVVGAEGEAVRPELLDERQERVEVAGGGGLPDQHPHAGAQALAALLGRVALVVGANAGGGVGLQALAEDARGVAVDVRGRKRELGQLVRVAGDDAGEVHHLGEPDHAPAAEEPLEVARVERAAGGLEGRGGDAGRGHEVDVERHRGAEVGEPVDAVGAEDVRDLVRVGDDGGGAEREDEAGELVHEQLRGLQMHMRVDEAGDDVLALGGDHLAAVVLAEAGDVAVADGHIGLQPFPGEDGEDPPALDDGVGELVAACHRKPSREIHAGTVAAGGIGGLGGEQRLAVRVVERRVDLAPERDLEADAAAGGLADLVHTALVRRIGDGDEQHRVGEAVGDRMDAAGDRLRQLVHRGLVEVDLREVDELHLLLLGEEPREIALADPAVLEHDLAEPAVGLLGLDERVAHGRRPREAVAHDQASQR